ncbi:MAG: DNA polymerase III subunit delta' [Deltaproteobacteria bacterium]|nr:DNA polymerase III subunit delta' [Deltaproteobacteria bacterium]
MIYISLLLMPFTDIIGHEKEIEILKNGILQNRVPHALIFAGQEGIGKRLTAIAFAKALNCLKDGNDFCGRCQNCISIDSLSFMDVFLVEPREPDYKGGKVDHISGTIKEEDITTIQQRIGYIKQKGRKKVCIIDSADKMNRTAQNKFLKTLEEPSYDSVIILVTSKPSDLLSTVISRCQRINFRPIKKDLIIEFIKDRMNISVEEAYIIASLSNGSIGEALKMDKDWILKQRRQWIEHLEGLSVDMPDDTLKFAEDVAKDDNIDGILEFLKIWYRDMAVCINSCEKLIVNTDMLTLLKKHCMNTDFEKIRDAFALLAKIKEDIMPPRYANKQLAMESLFVRMIQK